MRLGLNKVMSTYKTGTKYKKKWVVENYFKKGLTRVEAINGLVEEFDITYSYAKTMVYNNLSYLDWERSPYPANRASRIKHSKSKKDLLDQFKLDDTKMDKIDILDTDLNTENEVNFF